MRYVPILIFLAAMACQSAPPPPNAWAAMMVRMQRDQGLYLLSQIRSAPQPAEAKDLMAPAIVLLTRGQLYKEARRLAGTAINTFPTDPQYHQLLAEVYRAMLDAGLGSARTEKKMRHELDLATQLRNTPVR